MTGERKINRILAEDPELGGGMTSPAAKGEQEQLIRLDSEIIRCLACGGAGRWVT